MQPKGGAGYSDGYLRKAAGPTLLRLGRSIAVYANLITSGTLRRYYVANPRYFAFAVAPLFQLLALILLAAIAGWVAILPCRCRGHRWPVLWLHS